jgi:hypothetical protein
MGIDIPLRPPDGCSGGDSSATGDTIRPSREPTTGGFPVGVDVSLGSFHGCSGGNTTATGNTSCATNDSLLGCCAMCDRGSPWSLVDVSFCAGAAGGKPIRAGCHAALAVCTAGRVHAGIRWEPKKAVEFASIQ